jgi:hypothetical protein
LWSPNSDYIVVNITGEWKRIELKNIYLTEAKWRQINIGVRTTDERSFVELSKKEKDSFNKIAKFGARVLKTRDKTEITIEMKDFSSSMIIKKYGDKPNKIWDSNMENCHSLVLSPDEMYVAFLCELSGLFVMRLK